MMKRNSSLRVFIIAVSLLAISACTDEVSQPGSSLPAVRIGVIIPLSGTDETTGNDIRNGIDLACDIINNSHPLALPLAPEKGLASHDNLPVEIIYADSRGDPHISAEQVSSLVKDYGVVAIMGCYKSLATAAASERAEILKVPFLNVLSSSPALSQRGFSWFFQISPTDRTFADNFFIFLNDLPQKQDVNVSRLMVLLFENELFGTGVSRAERNFAGKYGFNILRSIPYDERESFFESTLHRVQDFMPAIILQTSYARDAVAIMRGYKAQGIHPTAILGMGAGFIDPYFLESLGDDGNFILSSEVWASDILDRKRDAGTIHDLFLRRFGKNMNGNSSQAFTGLIVLADALNRAPHFGNEALRKTLRETEMAADECIMPWDGIKFDGETGENLLGRGIIVQIQDQRYVTVWPWHLASAPVVWPMPLPTTDRGAHE